MQLVLITAGLAIMHVVTTGVNLLSRDSCVDARLEREIHLTSPHRGRGLVLDDTVKNRRSWRRAWYGRQENVRE